MCRITERRRRHPGRKLRPEMVAGIAREWRDLPACYRLSLEVDHKGRDLDLTELRIGPLKFSRRNVWEENEANTSIEFVSLTITRDIVTLTQKHPVSFSAHALGRFIERSGRSADRELVSAVRPALQYSPDDYVLGEEVAIPSCGGRWVGVVSRLYADGKPDSEAELFLPIRTWLSEWPCR